MDNKEKKSTVKKFALRLEPDVYEKLEKKAKADSRSVNAYINLLIKKDVEQ